MTQFVTRRGALTGGLAIGAASCAGAPKMTPFRAENEPQTGVFAHGVASGDPGPTSIVLWTRVTPPQNIRMGARLNIVWELARDESFNALAASGAASAGPSRDWTVKALAEGLAPGETYFYRFRLGEATSMAGRTRTLPRGALDQARFAVMSCSNYPFGHFNVYDLVARQEDLNAILHLGDYFYEYGPDGYGAEVGDKLGRVHNPPRETVTLADYRMRHAQYKSDPSSQAMLAAHPLIPIWDDHETTDNSWKDGAVNHQPETEGDWNTRKRAALQAYYEWMPVREPTRGPEHFFRSFDFGDLLTLAAIETRLMARDRQFEYDEIAPMLDSAEAVERFRNEILWDETRELLGAAQTDYLARVMRASAVEGKKWRLIANQIIMAEVKTPDLTPHVAEEDIVELEKVWPPARAFVEKSALGLPYNFDAWDGYPAARQRFYDLVRAADKDGMIVVTGDTHTWWANDLADRNGEPMGVELGTHSVTSPSPFDRSFLGGRGADYALLANRDNKAVRFVSGDYHGYINLTVGRDSARAVFHAVDNIESRDYNAFTHAAFDIERRGGAARYVDADGLDFREGWLF